MDQSELNLVLLGHIRDLRYEIQELHEQIVKMQELLNVQMVTGYQVEFGFTH